MKKGYSFNMLPALALVFVIAAVTIGVGATVQESTRSQLCTQGNGTATGTWATFLPLTATGGTAAVYPVTGGYTGCCSLINASNASDCEVWLNWYTMNITTSGLSGTNTLGVWLPTIAIVLMASIVIGILLYSFRFRGSA